MDGQMNGKNLFIIGALVFISVSGAACGGTPPEPPDIGRNTEDGQILFQDDFSNPASGWDQVQDSSAITDYEDGAYRMQINLENYDVWANPGRNFEDVRVEVTASVIGGPEENDFGLICRYQDAGNFYVFLIGSDGFWGIGGVLDGGELQLIGMEKMEFSPLIIKGRADNVIRADCVGDRLSLYINGTIVETVQDNRIRAGDVGLIAGTFDSPGTDVLFDDFIIRKPEK